MALIQTGHGFALTELPFASYLITYILCAREMSRQRVIADTSACR